MRAFGWKDWSWALAALALLAAAGRLAGPDLGGLRAWIAPPSETFWMPQADYGLPRRPQVGERVKPVASLPLDGRRPVQIYRLLDAPPVGSQAVLLPAVSGQVDLFVNGAAIRESLAGPPYLSLPGARPMLFAIPPDYFRPGRNRIDLLVRDGRGRALSVPLLLGPEPRLRAVATQLNRRTATAGRGLPLLALLAAVLAGLAAFSRRASRPFLPLAAAAAAFGTRAWLATAVLDARFEMVWPWLDRLLLVLALASLATLIRSGAMPTEPWRRRVLASLCGLVGAAALAGGWNGLGLFGGLWQLELGWTYDIGAAILLALLALSAGWVALVSGARFARTHLDLSRVVRRQRAEIDAAGRALDQEMRRSAILEERQRLARDMHDGIGGHLVSLIARARSKRIGVEEFESELSEGLAELRLMVDSLDATGESLSEALTAFRGRAQPQAEAAGLTLRWRQPDSLDVEAHDPRWILNLYRLLQEAVSNAARHSSGDRLDIEIRQAGERLQIDIADNGVGLAAGRAAAGKGLANMAYRARQMGASLEIGAGPDGVGTCVRLDLPVPRKGAENPLQSSGEINPS